MTCESARALLDFYRDRRLSPARMAEVERHLKECAGCAALAQPAAPAEPVRMPSSIRERLRKRLTAEDAEDAEGRTPGRKESLGTGAASGPVAGTAAASAAPTAGSSKDMRLLPTAAFALVAAWLGLLWLAHAATARWPAQQPDVSSGYMSAPRSLP